MRVYLNGEIIESDRAAVSAFNPSFLQGVGLFETLRSYAGRPLRLEQHIERMQNSAAKLHLSIARALPLVPEAVRAVLDANELTDARIRITVTPPDPGALAGSAEPGEDPLLLVTAQPIAAYPAELYEKGMTVLLCTDHRQSAHDPMVGHKTTSYFPRLLALRTAQERGWFTPANQLAEGCISNVFIASGGRLRTPPLDTPVLPGVTRALILEIAAEERIAVEESAIDVDTLLDADEVFLTNAIMEVMPVTRIERQSIKGEKPGEVTRRLMAAFSAFVAAQ
jgi:branched-subunit amino acid aminotransferase/4-amino-4-deoxychorismate lyase